MYNRAVPTPIRKKVQPSTNNRVIWLLAISALLLASPARGDDSATEQARQHYEIGSQQYDLGHWDEAIREYETAYELRPDPSFLYNLAQAYRRKGDNKRALDLYRNYLAKTPKSPLRAEIEERIKNLQKQIDEAASRPAPPVLEPTVPPPLPPPALPAVPAIAPVQEPVSSAPQAGPEPLTPPAPMAQPTSPVAPASAAAAKGPTVTDTAPPAARGRGLRIVGIVTGAVGVAGIVVGALAGAQAKSLSNSVASAPKFNQSDDSAGLRAQKAQWFFYTAGACVTAAGAVLYYLGVRAARTTPSNLSVSPVLGSGIAGVSAMGVF